MKFLRRIASRLSRPTGEKAVANPPATTARPAGVLNDRYLTAAPSEQNALDIFAGEWSSKFAPPFSELKAGSVPMFEDHRIHWFASEIGGFQQQQVLELGPLEGAHSYMLDRMGAQSVTAIESNTHAYLRCLITKEILGMPAVRFLCGDFMAYLRSPACPHYDIGLASGVLYHMIDPVELICLLAEHCKTHLLLWTHHYDATWAKTPAGQARLTSTQPVEHAGFRCTLHRYEYGAALDWGGFCGGPRPHCYWMEREEILACLRHFGFPHIRIGCDDPNHPHGPAFAVVASRKEAPGE
ncbi:MAG: hypothetical protein U0350_09345 [Caldilineaceae bacterium]